jgi:hypothetical protein
LRNLIQVSNNPHHNLAQSAFSLEGVEKAPNKISLRPLFLFSFHPAPEFVVSVPLTDAKPRQHRILAWLLDQHKQNLYIRYLKVAKVKRTFEYFLRHKDEANSFIGIQSIRGAFGFANRCLLAGVWLFVVLENHHIAVRSPVQALAHIFKLITDLTVGGVRTLLGKLGPSVTAPSI